MRNIFFNTASAGTLARFEYRVEKLVKLLQNNPSLRIELGGHTDNVGADSANLTLTISVARQCANSWYRRASMPSGSRRKARRDHATATN
ncbi:MAG: OmpA family protein [Flavobacteriales bacterium]|nr:OmpA family protein [Flavobacteriales bacterium]